MAFLDRDGVRIYYDVQGSGPAVLLSHGYSATSQMWARQVEALKDNYRVITWDMRGHGQSDSPDDQSLYSEEATCGDMAGILKELGIDKAVVGGLSLGGYMSLAFNVRYPEMVTALMLFDTGPGYKNPVGREGWNKTAEARAVAFETKGLESLGRGAEVRIAQHRSAGGTGDGGPRHARPVRFADHRVARAHHSADAGACGGEGRAFPGRHGLHGEEDRGLPSGSDPQRRPRRKPRSAGNLQRGDESIPGRPGTHLSRPGAAAHTPRPMVCLAHIDPL